MGDYYSPKMKRYGKAISLGAAIFLLFLVPHKAYSQVPDPVTVSSRVAASWDDAEEAVSSGTVGLSSSDLELGAEGGTTLQLVGMRFNNLQIPQGAVVTGAYIEFEVDETGSLATSLSIRGENADNAAAFASQTGNISARPATGTAAAWDNLPAWTTVSEKKQTPDISGIIGEIINRPGWASGNSLVVIIEGTGKRAAEAYNGEPANAPLLVVTYLPSGAPTPTPTLTPTPTEIPVPTPTPTPWPEGTIRFAVIGDFGNGSTDEGRVASLVNGWNPDLVITTGDNNYPDGEAATIDQNIGKYYSRYIGNYLGSYGLGSVVNRFWPSLGNHDWHTILCDLAGCTGAYFDYFTLPGNERYYHQDMGLVDLFAVDSDAGEPDGRSSTSVQANWLAQNLAASDACFKFVYFHHPPYSSGQHGSTLTMRWPFASWGADAVFSGHDHSYERVDVAGMPYFVNGAGGASLYAFTNLGTLPPEVTSVVRYNEDFGAMLVTAATTGVTYQFYNANGVLVDNYAVSKDCSNPVPTPTPAPSDTPSPTPTPTPTPTPLITPTPTSTPTPTPTPGTGVPVIISSRVAAGSDDAEEKLGNGTVNINSSDLELGAEDGASKLQMVGMRFTDVNIPQGATITGAYVEFEVDETGSGTTMLTVKGENSDNPVTFSIQSRDVSSRPATAASVSWDNVPAWLTKNEKKFTPDVSSVIQEIVNRPGWASGNSLVLTISGTGRRAAEAYNGEPANAPLLVVTYVTN